MSVITPCRPKWAGTLTDRERFRRQMHYQAADRCFNMEFGYWKENFQEWPIFKEHGVSDTRPSRGSAEGRTRHRAALFKIVDPNAARLGTMQRGALPP